MRAQAVRRRRTAVTGAGRARRVHDALQAKQDGSRRVYGAFQSAAGRLVARAESGPGLWSCSVFQEFWKERL
ncbi:hypothetical protein ACWGPW_12335 [Paenibacillus chitinolyticus]